MENSLIFKILFCIAWFGGLYLFYRFPDFLSPLYRVNFFWRKGKFVPMTQEEALKNHRHILKLVAIVGFIFMIILLLEQR